MDPRLDTLWPYYARIAQVILAKTAKKARIYITSNLVLKGTRRGPKPKRRQRIEILFTLGRPDYRERISLKKRLKKIGPFPTPTRWEFDRKK